MEMMALLLAKIEADRPGTSKRPEFFTTISAKNWIGEDKPIKILGPPFHLSKSRLDYLVPSGPPGWANDKSEWYPRE